MGLLDDLQGTLADVAANTANAAPSDASANPVLSHLIAMVNDPSTGGLQGLLQMFHDKGLGGIVSSWVSTGANQPISADQVTHALGADRLDQIAQSAGLPAGAVANQLSTLLPTVIDKLTPNGTVPQGGALATGLSVLQSVLGGHQPAPPPA